MQLHLDDTERETETPARLSGFGAVAELAATGRVRGQGESVNRIIGGTSVTPIFQV